MFTLANALATCNALSTGCPSLPTRRRPLCRRPLCRAARPQMCPTTARCDRERRLGRLRRRRCYPYRSCRGTFLRTTLRRRLRLHLHLRLQLLVATPPRLGQPRRQALLLRSCGTGVDPLAQQIVVLPHAPLFLSRLLQRTAQQVGLLLPPLRL